MVKGTQRGAKAAKAGMKRAKKGAAAAKKPSLPASGHAKAHSLLPAGRMTTPTLVRPRVLITAGPTQEPIDDVRFITNGSSGKMGAALALEAMSRGYDVTLVHGPVDIMLPGCNKIPIKTAKQMIDVVTRELKRGKGGYRFFISAAAIADFYAPKARGKIRSGKRMKLELLPTPKLIDMVRADYPEMFVVGFKAEYGMSRAELRVKAVDFMKRKGLDMVVANDIEKGIFGADENEVVIASRQSTKEFGRQSKRDMARHIWDEIELTTMRVCSA